MGSLSAVATLQLPVLHRGRRLGQPVDALIDTATWRALGFVVLCRDESLRFLPYAASQPGENESAVASKLILLDDVAFYRSRAASLRALLGGRVDRGGRRAGELRDVLLGDGGVVEELELERRGSLVRIPAAGSTITSTRADAA
jgi:hypothetical protein